MLMTSKLQKLSSSVQELLCIAACIGATFDVETLSQVTQQESSEPKLEIDFVAIAPKLTTFLPRNLSGQPDSRIRAFLG